MAEWQRSEPVAPRAPTVAPSSTLNGRPLARVAKRARVPTHTHSRMGKCARARARARDALRRSEYTHMALKYTHARTHRRAEKPRADTTATLRRIYNGYSHRRTTWPTIGLSPSPLVPTPSNGCPPIHTDVIAATPFCFSSSSHPSLPFVRLRRRRRYNARDWRRIRSEGERGVKGEHTVGLSRRLAKVRCRGNILIGFDVTRLCARISLATRSRKWSTHGEKKIGSPRRILSYLHFPLEVRARIQ